jgi:hypothetical protein
MIKVFRRKECVKPLILDIDGILVKSARYVISTYGRILDKDSDKYIQSNRNDRGYERVQLEEKGLFNKTYRGLHRLVALAFIKNPNNFNQVLHIDGDKSNNFSHNLKWASDSDVTYAALSKRNKAGFTEGEVHKIGSLMMKPWNYHTILRELGYDKDTDYKKFEILMSVDKNIKYSSILTKYKRVAKNSEPIKFRDNIASKDIIERSCKLMEEDNWSYEGICISLQIEMSYRRSFKKILSSVYLGKKYKGISSRFDIKNPVKENNRYNTETIDAIKSRIIEGIRNIDIIGEFGCSESFLLRIKKSVA